jgi:hypothetical protein
MKSDGVKYGKQGLSTKIQLGGDHQGWSFSLTLICHCIPNQAGNDNNARSGRLVLPL